jgi:hypothetical protein
MRLVEEHAAKRNVDLKLIPGAKEWIARAYERGYGSYDYSSVVAAIRGREATG